MTITTKELRSIAATIQLAAPSAREITIYLKHNDLLMGGKTSVKISAEYADGSEETLSCPITAENREVK